MDKLKIALTLLTILIIVVPIVSAVLLYRDNLIGLVIPPEIKILFGGNSNQTQFQLPTPNGNPRYDPEREINIYPFMYTNSMPTELTINRISADVICKEHNVILGHIELEKELIIESGENVPIDAIGSWTSEAREHFEEFHSGPEDNSIYVSLVNLYVDIGGAQLYFEELEYSVWVPLPR